MDPLFFAVAAPAIVVAGAAKAGFGGSGAFVATPFVAIMLPPGDALGVMLPLLIAIDLLTLRPYWGRWSAVDARALMVSGTLGVALGWALLSLIDPDVIKVAIGLVAIVFVVQRAAQAMGWRPEGEPRFGLRRAGIWGFVSGFTSFVAHSGGPPAAMALIPRGLEKTVYQATTVAVFTWINLAKAGPYFLLGLFDGANLGLSAALLPAAALGVIIGIYGHDRVPQRYFDLVVIACLLGAGGKLLFDGTAALLAG